MYWDKSTKHPQFEVSIKALIYDQDRKLFFAKDQKGKWDLPGGRLDENEKMEECLRREVQEELGVNVKNIRGIRCAEVLDYDDKQKRVLIAFEVEVESLNFKTSDENIENRFVAKEDFEQMVQSYEGLKTIKEKLYDRSL